MQKKRLVIVEDHPFVRLGIKAMLACQQEIAYTLEVVEEASDGESGWQAILGCVPDLVLLDLSLPHLDGYEVLRRVMRMPSRPKVIVISAHPGSLPVRRALEAGADGYIYKSEGASDLLRGIEAAFAGYRFVPPDIGWTPDAAPWGNVSALSPRERCIADRLIAGQSNKAIAHMLCLSAKTVSAHKRNILRKLAIRHVIELADCLRHVDSYGMLANGVHDTSHEKIASMHGRC